MPTRPDPQVLPDSSSSSIVRHPYRPIHSLHPLFARLRFYVVPAKIDADLSRVYECIEELGGKCVGVEDAMFVVTALRGRPRLAKSIGTQWIRKVRLLSVDYIYDTFQRCMEAANSRSEEPPRLLPPDEYTIRLQPETLKHPIMIESDEEDRAVKRIKLGPSSDGADDELPDMEPFPEDVQFEDIPKLCVLRPSPLICVNQDIIEAIRPIYEDREFEESHQKNSNILSYRRSMSVLKCLPRKVRSGKDARRLYDVGERVAQRIDEYLATGHIAESEEILASSRFKALRLFASIYTVGPHTAKELYDKHHCRTLDDVRLHYESMAEVSEPLRPKEKARRQKEGGMLQTDIVAEWIKIKDELDSKISRREVQEIADCVMENLNLLVHGCKYTLCGGYRRGKSESSDVDIVFAPPNVDQDIGLLKDLHLRLGALGIITHVLHVTQRAAEQPVHSSPNNFDNLDKAFVILKLPGSGRLHRRVDLISAPKERYAAAVLSWSGSMMFERDLKRYSEAIGWKFRAGLISMQTGKEVFLETEREIFHFLGLRYVPPHLRNADA